MNLLDRLLGLQRLSLGREGVTLGWQYPLPLWLWTILTLAVGAAAWISYRRLLGPRRWRIALATLRAMVILAVAVALAGPMLVFSDEKIEEDRLLILVDRSASMNIRDTWPAAAASATPIASTTPATDGEPISRDRALRDALAAQAGVFGQRALGHERSLLWFAFDRDARPLDPAAAATGALPQADGQTTQIGSAITQALAAAAGRPVSGVVLLSDGRSPQTIAGPLLRQLQQQAIGVYPVPLGAAQTPLDLVVGQVDAPDKAFVNDVAPVTVWIDAYPAAAAQRLDPARVQVRLVDERDGRVLDEATASPVGLAEPILLRARSRVVGPARWKVEVHHDALPDAALPRRELVTSNNTRDVRLELIDRPIRVLYVEGYPRWEYRYLKNMLIREKSIDSSVLLLSADREFAQEGDTPIARLPAAAAELEPYDVVIIGDVPATYFSAAQLALLRDHVALRGGGLLWIGGAYATPRTYEGTPLEALLPMRGVAAVERMELGGAGVTPRPTPLATMLGVMQLLDPAAAPPPGAVEGGAAVDPSGIMPTALPPLYWVQDLGPLKATAEVIADVGPAPGGEGRADRATAARGDGSRGAERPSALIARLRYGAGESLYVGTDDTWRWRYGRGELFFEQFWVQLVRMLARGRLQAFTGGARFSVSNRRLGVDQTTVVELVVRDPALLVPPPTQVRVTVLRASDARSGEPAPPEPIDELTLLPAPASASTAGPGGGSALGAPTVSAEGQPMTYRATWRPRGAGDFELRVSEASLQELGLAQRVEVVAEDDELRQTQPDHERLTALAALTGGASVPLNELDRLVELVPNRSRKTPSDIRESLADSYVTLIAVLALLTLEWVGRKALRLV